MKYKITTELDTETGDYMLQFNNDSNPEEGVDYNLAMEAMRKIFGDFERKMSRKIEITDGPLRLDN